MKRAIAVWTAMLVCAFVVFGQAPPSGPPKPGPEHKRLGYLAGNWHLEGVTKPGPFGPGGKVDVTEHNELFPGGFFVVLHAEGKGPMGAEKSLATLGYDRQQKSYILNSISSLGIGWSAKGTVEGDTWTFATDLMGGSLKVRIILKELSATSMIFKFESSSADGPWETMMEGKGTKAE